MLNCQLMLPRRKCSFFKRGQFSATVRAGLFLHCHSFMVSECWSTKTVSPSWTINGYRNPLIRKCSSLTLEMPDVHAKISMWRWIIITWLITITQDFWTEYKTSFPACWSHGNHPPLMCSLWQLYAVNKTFIRNNYYKKVWKQRHESESKTVCCFTFPSFLLKSLLFTATFMSI